MPTGFHAAPFGFAAVLVTAGTAALAASSARAQSSPDAVRPARADSVLGARGLAGSARVALDVGSARLDGGQFSSLSASLAAAPFVSEHLQIGLAPTYAGAAASTPASPGLPASTSTYRSYGAGLTANYVFGGDRRWHGYAGGYGAASGATYMSSGSQLGAQAGALFFLDPAVALRAELRYRVTTSGVGARRGVGLAVLTLDPYVFGRAGAGGPTRAGLGAADVSVFAYDQRSWYGQQRGISGTLAPYLTRWAQVGIEGQVSRVLDYSVSTASYVREFGRLYLPLTARTQPFAEAFVQHGTFADADLQDGSGWTFGVRQLLAPRVALDVGVRRTIPRALTLGPAGDGYRLRFPGQTGLVAGLATRLGRMR